MAHKKTRLVKLVLSALFLSLALLLPFLTGQIAEIGNMLCPMHLPVLLCGFFCGPYYAALVGFIAPLMRFMLFSMPAIFPNGLAMAFELAAYGLVCGMLYRLLPKKKYNIYVSLISAMIAGRIVWGAVRTLLYGLGRSPFSWAAFLAGAFTNAIPGIIIQIIIIPVLVITVSRVFDKNTLE